LKVQSSNCDPPDVRNQLVFYGNGSSPGRKLVRHYILLGDSSRAAKFLGKSKDDILIPPRKANLENKLTAKELERVKKWQNMAVVERPGGGILYRFPVSKKVLQRTFKGIPDCWRTTVWHDWLDSQAQQRGDRESERDLIKDYYVPIPQSTIHE